MMVATAVLLALARTAQPAATIPPVGLDHILVGVPNLDLAVVEVARKTGVSPKLGGSHPGVGTRNALLSLGNGSYLELIGVDPAQKPGEFGKFVAGLRRMMPLGWALHTTDIDALHSALAARGVRVKPIMPGSRIRPDGKVLRWRNFEIGPEQDVSPFFIQWARSSIHPSIDAPQGCRVEHMVVGGPAKPNVRRALRLVRQDGVLEPGSAAGLRFLLLCPGGSIRF